MQSAGAFDVGCCEGSSFAPSMLIGSSQGPDGVVDTPFGQGTSIPLRGGWSSSGTRGGAAWRGGATHASAPNPRTTT